jgi:fluoride exporter
MIVDWALVLLGGLIGAPARYLTGELFKARLPSPIPWGTFTVNIAASFILAFFFVMGTEGAVSARAGYLLDNGFCGALSTWSTFSFELLTLASARKTAAAAVYLAAGVGIGMGASYAGAGLARALG